MNIGLLLMMAASAHPDRVAVGSLDDGLTYAELLDRAQRAAGWLGTQSGERLVLLDVNSEALPIAVFGAALAGRPFAPLNYRLADDRLAAILERVAPATAVVDAAAAASAGVAGIHAVPRAEFLAASVEAGAVDDLPDTADEPAVLLFTSGTSAEPKAAVLRHRHLFAYVSSTVELGGAEETDAALVSVPPYHIAGLSAVLTGVYGGRRIVYLPSFEPEQWVQTAQAEAITHAMVVPTMLSRILDTVEATGVGLPALRHISYGGGRMPLPVIERALELLRHVAFVNAYGLTETSSTVALLGPDDHRDAFASADPAVRARLGSVGKPLPGIELEIRDEQGRALPRGEAGEIWLRGEQVAGEYVGAAGGIDGWFDTKDRGSLDAEGFIYLEGRSDDVIVRGGENLSPGEIEDRLARHPGVAEAAVVGLPDTEWGQVPVAVVVAAPGETPDAEELRQWVRDGLRSSRMPDRIVFVAELPYGPTGKLLRRALRDELLADANAG